MVIKGVKTLGVEQRVHLVDFGAARWWITLCYVNFDVGSTSQ